MESNNSTINNPLGYSVIHEYRQKPKKKNKTPIRRNHNLLRNKQSMIWVPDNAVTNCYNCNITFTFLRETKHHCRLCSKIFCDSCTPHRKKIPTTWNHRNEKGPVRLCHDCSDQIDLLEPLDVLINVFTIVMPDLEMLATMAKVCHSWNNLSHYFLGKMRNIQYKPINEPFTRLESQILWTNRKYWFGHSHWTSMLLRSIDYNSYQYRTKQHQELLRFLITDGKSKYNCLDLMCTRNCYPSLLPYHAIVLLGHSSRNSICKELEQFLFTILKKINPQELKLYLPFLVNQLEFSKVDGNFCWGDLLLQYASNNIEIAMELYWNLYYRKLETHSHHGKSSIYQFYLTKLLDTLPDNIIKSINASFDFVKILESIPDHTNLYELKNYFRQINITGTVVPFNPYLIVQSVFVPKISIKKSATKPIFIPLECIDSRTGDIVKFELIYKFEDVKKDYMILKVIRLMKYLLSKYENIDLEIVDYAVCPIGLNTGIIEAVPKCQTAGEIGKKFSIWNFIVENNPNSTVENLRSKFVKSCATYCIVTYLLGVGDRHLLKMVNYFI